MQYSLKWQERSIEKNISGGGVGRGKGYERVERALGKITEKWHWTWN